MFDMNQYIRMTLFNGVIIALICFTEGSTIPREKRNACNPFNMCYYGQPCANGGNCSRDETTCLYSCECVPGFTGKSCETLITTTCETDLCLTSDPCYNGASCEFDNSTCSVSCRCTGNFTGDTCNDTAAETPTTESTNVKSASSPNSCVINYCLDNPCVNDGTCKMSEDCRVSCDCTEEYTGDQCQFPLSESTTTRQTTTLRNFTERSCGLGFMCFHGKCTWTEAGLAQCQCDEGYIHTFCQTPCDLDCGDNGKCDRVNYTTPPYCQCKLQYTGTKCEVFRPKIGGSDDWKYWVAGSCVVLVLVLGGLIILLYALRKRRNIFVMKVRYMFQPFEDDDGKMFDAFIFYKSAPEDEAFVYRVLYTELEVKRSYKLCLHQRDFRVGENIANNILWAIQNSRRTILVLSPRYMESDFTRFEYQEAHAEMVKLQHKVIPLLLDDVSKQKHLMDNTLTSILKSITYIEWPKDDHENDLSKFWKRLELSMPKKRSKSESSEADSYPVLSFSNSSFNTKSTMVDYESGYKGKSLDDDFDSQIPSDEGSDNNKTYITLDSEGNEKNDSKSDIKEKSLQSLNTDMDTSFKNEELKRKELEGKSSELEQYLDSRV